MGSGGAPGYFLGSVHAVSVATLAHGSYIGRAVMVITVLYEEPSQTGPVVMVVTVISVPSYLP